MQINVENFKCVVTSKLENEYQKKDGSTGITRKLTIVNDNNSMAEITVPDNERLVDMFRSVEAMHPYIVSFSLDDKYGNVRIILGSINDDTEHPLYAYYKASKKNK